MTPPPAPLRSLTAAQRRRLLTLTLAGLGAFFALALLAQLRLLVDAEWEVQSLVQALRTHALELPMRAVSWLGTGWVLGPVAAAGCLVIRVRHAGLALAVVAAGAAAMAAGHVAKVLVIRQRPNTVLWAYPSAHTFGIVVFVSLLLYVLWALDARPRWRRLALLGGAVLVVAVGTSRLYLNAHWIGDVLGGLAGGLAFGAVGVLLIDRRLVTG